MAKAKNNLSEEQREERTNAVFEWIVRVIALCLILAMIGLPTLIVLNGANNQMAMWQSIGVGSLIGLAVVWYVLHENSYNLIDASMQLIIMLILGVIFLFMLKSTVASRAKKTRPIVTYQIESRRVHHYRVVGAMSNEKREIVTGEEA